MDEITKITNLINPPIAWEVVRQLFFLLDAVRGQGVNILGMKGSGKSRLIGFLTWQDFLRGTGGVLLDAVGASIDNFLWKACQILPQLPREVQEHFWHRIVVWEVGRGDTIIGAPLYYRLGNESLYEIAQRPLDTFKQADPNLVDAPMSGWNALWRIGTHAGIILAALGYQITEAEHLLRHPTAWLSRFAEAVARYPEAAPSVAFFTEEYTQQWSKEKQVSLTEAFRTKIELFTTDPTMRAMFGASEPGINWQAVVDQGKIVIPIFRHVHDMERRRFLLLWILKYILSFIKHRGPGRHRPLALYIDELSLLTGLRIRGESLVAAELNELVNVYGRNNRVWLTTAEQELYQFDQTTQKMLLSMGTQIFSSTSDIDAALTIARNLFDADSMRVKWWHPIYAQMPDINAPAGRFSIGKSPQVIDYRPEFMRLDEQNYETAKKIKNQQTFHFFVRPALAEGTNSTKVYPVTIKDFDRELYVNAPLVERARRLLAKRSGIPRDVLLDEIAARIQGIPVPQPTPRKTTHRDATMKGYEQYTYLPSPIADGDTDDGTYVDYK